MNIRVSSYLREVRGEGITQGSNERRDALAHAHAQMP
jgi:hypothetical protein